MTLEHVVAHALTGELGGTRVVEPAAGRGTRVPARPPRGDW